MNQTRIKRSFETNLYNRDEVFRLLALGEALRLPVLLLGPPGVGKTAATYDYSKSKVEGEEGITNKVFLLETNSETRAKEINGYVNIKELIENKEYKKIYPAATADVIIFNEIDKAKGALRNSILSVINERTIFDGENEISCDWRLCVATCNNIPDDEEERAFWDRFVIKSTVSRLNISQINQYMKLGGKAYLDEKEIEIPSREEILNVEFPQDKIAKFISISYNKVSDRTLSYVPMIAGAISLIWKTGIDSALVKAAELLVDKDIAKRISQEIMSKHKKEILTDIHILTSQEDHTQSDQQIKAIFNKVKDYKERGLLTSEDVQDIKNIMANNYKASKVKQNTGNYKKDQ
jgi:MoxR-like ATPase